MENEKGNVNVTSHRDTILSGGSIIGIGNQSYAENNIDLAKLAKELRQLQGELRLLADETGGDDYVLAYNEVGEIYKGVSSGEQPAQLKDVSLSSKNIISKIATEIGLPILLDLTKKLLFPGS